MEADIAERRAPVRTAHPQGGLVQPRSRRGKHPLEALRCPLRRLPHHGDLHYGDALQGRSHHQIRRAYLSLDAHLDGDRTISRDQCRSVAHLVPRDLELRLVSGIAAGHDKRQGLRLWPRFSSLPMPVCHLQGELYPLSGLGLRAEGQAGPCKDAPPTRADRQATAHNQSIPEVHLVIPGRIHQGGIPPQPGLVIDVARQCPVYQLADPLEGLPRTELAVPIAGSLRARCIDQLAPKPELPTSVSRQAGEGQAVFAVPQLVPVLRHVHATGVRRAQEDAIPSAS